MITLTPLVRSCIADLTYPAAPSSLPARRERSGPERFWASRRGAPIVQVDLCLLSLPAGFPPVPQYLGHQQLLTPAPLRTGRASLTHPAPHHLFNTPRVEIHQANARTKWEAIDVREETAPREAAALASAVQPPIQQPHHRIVIPLQPPGIIAYPKVRAVAAKLDPRRSPGGGQKQ